MTMKDSKVIKVIASPRVSKSSRIRELASEGKTKTEIAKIIGIRYQFAYNVLNRPLKIKVTK